MLARLENTNVRKRATKFCIDSNKSHHNASHRHHLCHFNSLSPKSLTYLFYCQVTSSGQCLNTWYTCTYLYFRLLQDTMCSDLLRKSLLNPFVKTDDVVCFWLSQYLQQMKTNSHIQIALLSKHIILIFIAIMLESNIYFPKISLFSCPFAYNTLSD